MLNRNSIIPAEGALTTDTMYYFENRQRTGWDQYLPGWGMLVWRVVYDKEDWHYNSPNNTTTRFLLVAANGATPYTNDYNGGKRQDVPFPGSWYVTDYEPYEHASLSDIEEKDGVVTFQFTNKTTGVEVPVINDLYKGGQWYNVLGQPIDIQSYRGVAVHSSGVVVVR